MFICRIINSPIQEKNRQNSPNKKIDGCLALYGKINESQACKKQIKDYLEIHGKILSVPKSSDILLVENSMGRNIVFSTFFYMKMKKKHLKKIDISKILQHVNYIHNSKQSYKNH